MECIAAGEIRALKRVFHSQSGRVGELQTGANFGDEVGRGRESVGGNGWKSSNFGLWNSPEM